MEFKRADFLIVTMPCKNKHVEQSAPELLFLTEREPTLALSLTSGTLRVQQLAYMF